MSPRCLHELRGLNDGWLDGEGVAPSDEGLTWLAEKFDHLYPDDLPLPYLYPTPQGDIQAEWSLGPYQASLTISLDAYRGDWHALFRDTNAEKVEVLSLAHASGWARLAELIRSLSEAT